MGALIDTSVLVAAQRGQLDLGRLLAAGGGEPLAIAAISASELLHGVHRLRGVRRATQESHVNWWLERFPVIPFDLDVARVHAALMADLDASGARMAAHDAIIAATALRLGYGVATRDRRSFGRIEDLDVRYW